MLKRSKLSTVLVATLLISFLFISVYKIIPFAHTINSSSQDPTVVFSALNSDGSVGFADSGNYTQDWINNTGTFVSNATIYLIIGQIYDGSYEIDRGFVFFNTSSIPSSATIISATLSFNVSDNGGLSTNFNVTIQNGQPTFPHDPLLAGDYAQGNYSGNYGQLDTTGLVQHAWYNVTVTNTSIISKAGETKLCLRSDREINEITPSGYEYLGIYSSRSGSPEKLYVTYSINSSLTYANVAASSTYENESCVFTATFAGSTLSNYVFGTNLTGTFVNDSAVNISGTSYVANTTKTLPDSVGSTVQWAYWFSDSFGDENNTGLQNLTITFRYGLRVLTNNEYSNNNEAQIWDAQGFQLPYNSTVTSASFYVSDSSGPMFAITVKASIRLSDGNGAPTGGDIVSSEFSFNYEFLSWANEAFTPTHLTANTNYTLILWAEDYSFHWAYNTSNGYAFGVRSQSGDGSSWSVQPNNDHAFRIYGYVDPTVTVENTTGGTTSPPAGAYAYAYGSNVTINETANAGYGFSGWFVNGSNAGLSNPLTFVLTDDTTVNATFSLNPNLIILGNTGGNTNPLAGNYSFPTNSTVTIYENYSAGYSFGHWLVNSSSDGSSNPLVFIITGDTDVQPVFIETNAFLFPTSYNTSLGGSITTFTVIINGSAPSGEWWVDWYINGSFTHPSMPSSGTTFTWTPPTSDFPSVGTYSLFVEVSGDEGGTWTTSNLATITITAPLFILTLTSNYADAPFTVDSVLNYTPYTEQLSVGTHTVVFNNTFYYSSPFGFVIVYFDHWIDTNSTSLTRVIDLESDSAYSVVYSLNNPNNSTTPILVLPTGMPMLWQYIANFDLLGFIVACYVTLIGEVFFAFIAFISFGLLYLKTKSVVLCSILWLLTGGTWITMTKIISPIAVIFTALGISGMIYRLFTHNE